MRLAIVLVEMPAARKRKSEATHEGDTKRQASAPVEDESRVIDLAPADNATSVFAPTNESTNAAQQRADRFAALKARNTDSRKANLRATTTEKQKLSTNTASLTSLNRKKDVAAHNLLRADVEAAGDDFERKRAWDWTVEESERWDMQVEQKERNKSQIAFKDYTDQAAKVYEGQLKHIKPDLDAYEKEKAALLEKATISGGLEIVETPDGELIAVDRDGSFYSTADSTNFVNNKPPKEAVDRLVTALQNQNEARMKKRRNKKDKDDGDVTYINEKNKQFNMKLARYVKSFTYGDFLLTSPDSITSTLPTFERASSAALLFDEQHCCR